MHSSDGSRDDKGLATEILPDPTEAERSLGEGSPRERTAAHLRKIVAAAAGMAFSAGIAGGALGDATVPGGDKNGGKDGKGKEVKPVEPKPPDPGYGVVDPIPEPYINRVQGTGFLEVRSTPDGAVISVDGTDIGKKTPLKKWKLQAGSHVITLVSADGKVTENVSVEIKPKQTVKLTRDLHPPKPKPEPAK